jgi:A/G-specific adenine glycosylase
MLQQTQVETVLPYYRRWLERFPNLKALAIAPQQDVLALWEGLGYYARARNLHRAAQKIVNEYHGRMPRTLEGLRTLPGIGRYTAAAIASIAFEVDAAVLDGNVKRVLARVFDVREDVKSPRGEKKLWEIAESLLPRGRAGDYNQALMDLGATLCTPRAPACSICPLRTICVARKLGVQLERPVARPRAAVPHHTFVAGVVYKRGQVLITQRPADQLLGGLWAFPAGRCDDSQTLTECLSQLMRKKYGIRVSIGSKAQTLNHGFTHFRMTVHVYECRWQTGRAQPTARNAQSRWVRVAELNQYPMGKIDRQIAKRLLAERVK